MRSGQTWRREQPAFLIVLWAFLFQTILILFLALRKWNFDTTLVYGWMVYGLGIPAVVISTILLLSGMEVSFWLGGFLYLTWGIFGSVVEYVKKIQWRNHVRGSILLPYVTLYMGTIMFYLWPLGLISRPLWFGYAAMFMISTILNFASHKGNR